MPNLGSVRSQASVSSIQFIDAQPVATAKSSKTGILKGSSVHNQASTNYTSNN